MQKTRRPLGERPKEEGAAGRGCREQQPVPSRAAPSLLDQGHEALSPTLGDSAPGSHTRSSGCQPCPHLLRACCGRQRGLPPRASCGRTCSFSQSPRWLSLRLRGRFADFLLSGSPAPCSGSDKLVVFSLRALGGLSSQPSRFKGHQATPPMRLSISFASITFPFHVVSRQYRFSLSACLGVQLPRPSESTYDCPLVHLHAFISFLP